jgi:hypothetical protein
VSIGQGTPETQVPGLRWKHWGAKQATATGTTTPTLTKTVTITSAVHAASTPRTLMFGCADEPFAVQQPTTFSVGCDRSVVVALPVAHDARIRECGQLRINRGTQKFAVAVAVVVGAGKGAVSCATARKVIRDYLSVEPGPAQFTTVDGRWQCSSGSASGSCTRGGSRGNPRYLVEFEFSP